MADDAPDFSQGVPLTDIPADGVLGVKLGDDPWLLARVDGQIVALAGACTHYSGPLAEGLRSGDTVRCPWHHACFSLRTGQAVEAPAFDPLARRKVEVRDGRAFPGDELAPEGDDDAVSDAGRDKTIVVVGGGAAGFAAVDRLKALGHRGPLHWLGVEDGAPCDRPNLSKDYLAGEAEADWLALGSKAVGETAPRPVRVTAIHPDRREVELEGGERLTYDALLLAPGAEPKRPKLPGFERDDVRVLRTREDADAIIAQAEGASRVVVVGSGFIGLEVAASLRQRKLEVAVVTPEQAPLAGKVGPELAAWVKAVHEEKGVVFHLGREAKAWDGSALDLDDGARLEADLLVVGVGVAPRLELAEAVGLAHDGAIPVDATMKVKGADAIWAAGDVARFPDPISGQDIRVEHWVAAERQGQIAAAAILGLEARWAEPPFFWSVHFEKNFRYVGHAEGWDTIEVDGVLSDNDAELRYLKAGRVLAVVTVGRDHAGLEAAKRFRETARGRQP